MRPYLLTLLVVLGTISPALAKKCIYHIKTKTEDSTYNDIRMIMFGEKSGKNTGWFTLKGSKTGEEDNEYVLEDVGPIRSIEIRIKNQVIFGVPDGWTATWVKVEWPWPNGQMGSAKSTFILGKNIAASNAKTGTRFTANSITDRPAISVSRTGKIQHDDKIVKVAHFFNNPTSGSITAMQSKETWSRTNSVGLSNTVTSESTTAIGLSYSSPETVAGQFGATADKSWSDAVSRTQETAQQDTYSKEQDWTYTVEPRTAKFRQLVLRVPTEYALYQSDSGQKRWIRYPGGPVTDTGTGEQLEIPQTDRNGNVEPVDWSYIQNTFWPYMDESNRQKAISLKNSWIQKGWVYVGAKPTAVNPQNPTPPVNPPTPVNPPNPPTPTNPTTPSNLSPLTAPMVYGVYRYEPYSNGYHEGTIQPLGNGNLRWTNQAGVSWDLHPDLNSGVLRKDAGSVYQDMPGGQQFQIVRGSNGQVTGFRFMNEIYSRKGSLQVTVQSLLGSYRYEPYSNGYHQGTISDLGNGVLKWTNQAGYSWDLVPDLAAGVLRKRDGSPYQTSPGGQQFQILKGSAGEITGFRFLGEVYNKQ